MNKKQQRYSDDIRKAHDTCSMLKSIGVNLTGNEFIGLIKNIGNFYIDNNVSLEKGRFGPANPDDIRGKKTSLEAKLNGSKPESTEPQDMDAPYIDVHCLHGKSMPGDFRVRDQSRVYYKDGEFHIAYF